MAGAAASAIWAVIDRWLAEGTEVERLPPMIDEAFTLLERGSARLARQLAEARPQVPLEGQHARTDSRGLEALEPGWPASCSASHSSAKPPLAMLPTMSRIVMATSS